MANLHTPAKLQEDQAATDDAPESPTTAQPIDFDDDQQETGVVAPDGTTTITNTPSKPLRTSSIQPIQQSTDDTPPPKPPRPMDSKEQAEATLIEAFPSVDAKVVRAVLDASGNNVEKAFNALLRMSDPDFNDEAPPQRPPRPTPHQQQMEQDELYARQLAAHYNSQPGYGQVPRGPPNQQRPYHDEEEPSSLDDDFAAIRENVRQGFLSTQNTVNKWISNFKRKMDGEEEEDEIGPGPAGPQRQNFGPSRNSQLQGINNMGSKPRKSTDQDRYDADPKVLSDDFKELELHDEEASEEIPPKKPQRPQVNPDLFKSMPAAPQSGPVDEVDALYSAPGSTNRQPSPSGGGTKSKKWQPLTSVAPAPEQDDNDPFSLGDSDDEEKKHDVRQEDTERLKRAAAESISVVSEDERRESLEPHQRSGSNATKDRTAEDLLKGVK